MKKASATHKSMGKKGGAEVGLESGVAHVEKYHAGQGVEVDSKSHRPKPQRHGSIAHK